MCLEILKNYFCGISCDSSDTLGYALFVLLVTLLYKQIKQRFKYLYEAKWFRPTPWMNQFGWEDIRKILEDDPLSNLRYNTRWPKSTSTVLFEIALFLIAISLVGVLASLLHNWWLNIDVREIFLYKSGDTKSGTTTTSGTAVIIASFLALMGTIYVAATQLRAKVRSENRQKWIDDVRATLAEVLNHIPSENPNHLGKNKMTKPSDANRARIRLELLLNPSEKDHRTLGFLLRRAYGIEPIKIDCEVRKQLKGIGVKYDNKDIDEVVDSWEKNDRIMLFSWIIRISNAMLKREWELVKYGR